MNYTKGEWKVVPIPMDANNRIMSYHSDYYRTAIADVFGMNGEDKANAHLIAAAPMMYEALKAFDDYLCAAPPHNMKLKAYAVKFMEQALAKVEGRDAE